MFRCTSCEFPFATTGRHPRISRAGSRMLRHAGATTGVKGGNNSEKDGTSGTAALRRHPPRFPFTSGSITGIGIPKRSSSIRFMTSTTVTSRATRSYDGRFRKRRAKELLRLLRVASRVIRFSMAARTTPEHNRCKGRTMTSKIQPRRRHLTKGLVRPFRISDSSLARVPTSSVKTALASVISRRPGRSRRQGRILKMHPRTKMLRRSNDRTRDGVRAARKMTGAAKTSDALRLEPMTGRSVPGVAPVARSERSNAKGHQHEKGPYC